MAGICIVFLSSADAAGTDLKTADEYKCSTDLNTGDSDDDDSMQLMEADKRERGGLKSFFDYAAKRWGSHSRLGEISFLSRGSSVSYGNEGASEEHLLDRIAMLCHASTSTFRAWFQLCWNTISTISQFPDGLTPLLVASHIGLPRTIEALLKALLKPNLGAAAAQSRVRQSDSEGWTALHWAV